jgi:hypothetical protein
LKSVGEAFAGVALIVLRTSTTSDDNDGLVESDEERLGRLRSLLVPPVCPYDEPRARTTA